MHTSLQNCLQTSCLTHQRGPALNRNPLRICPPTPLPRKSSQPCHKHIVRARSRQETQQPPGPISAPPVRAPPPPPPPPNPNILIDPEPNRRNLLWIVLGIGLSYINAQNQPGPPPTLDERGNLVIMSKGGVPISMYRNELGNIEMVDPKGTLYYDTGDDRLGMYVVQRDGRMWNLYKDKYKREQRVLMGNINDIEEIRVKEFAGVPIETIQKSFAKLQDPRDSSGKKLEGKFPDTFWGFREKDTPFPDAAVEYDMEDVRKTEDGDVVLTAKAKTPPMLLEGTVKGTSDED